MPVLDHLHQHFGEDADKLRGKILIRTDSQQFNDDFLLVLEIRHEVNNNSAANVVPHGINDGDAGKYNFNCFRMPFNNLIRFLLGEQVDEIYYFSLHIFFVHMP